MKSIFLHSLLVLAFAVSAQTTSGGLENILEGRMRVDAASLRGLQYHYPAGDRSRMLGNIVLDYDSTDAEDASRRDNGLYFRYIWDLNSRYTENDTNRLGLKWAVVRFDTLVDMSTGTAVSYPRTGASIVLDSLKLTITHENTTGTPDTIHVSVYEWRGGAGIQVNGQDEIINPVLWDTLIITTTSLTAGHNKLGTLTVFPNLALNYPNNRFVTGVHFYGDTANSTFTVLAGYKDLCNELCFAYPSILDLNSIYHLVTWVELNHNFPGLPAEFNCNGNGVVGEPEACEEFPIQNFAIRAFVTMENHFATLTGSVFIDADSNCIADSSDTRLRDYLVHVVGVARHKTHTDYAGNYKIFFTTPGNYELHILADPQLTEPLCPDSGILSVSIPVLDSLYTGYDFALRDTTEEPVDTVDTTSGILDLQNSVLIYPNPFTDYLAVEINVPVRAVEFGIYDLQGKLLRKYTIPPDGKLQLTGLNLAKGMYFYRVTEGEEAVAEGKLIR